MDNQADVARRLLEVAATDRSSKGSEQRRDALKAALTTALQQQYERGHQALVEALEWYGEQARLCRLIHSEGDRGRQALADDGGVRARSALAAIKEQKG